MASSRVEMIAAAFWKRHVEPEWDWKRGRSGLGCCGRNEMFMQPVNRRQEAIIRVSLVCGRAARR